MGRERHRERKKREVKWNSNWKKNQYVLAFSVCSRIEIGLEWWDMSSWLQMVRTGVSDRDEGKSVYFRVIQYENVLISWFHTRCQVAGRGIIFVAAMQTHTHTYSIHLRRWRAGETKFCVSFILRHVRPSVMTVQANTGERESKKNLWKIRASYAIGAEEIARDKWTQRN